MKKCYYTHLVMTHSKFIAQILQCGGILNIVISHSLLFCSSGKTFLFGKALSKGYKQSPCNL